MTGFMVFYLFTSTYFSYKNTEEDFAATLEINNTASDTSPLTGETFIYTIQYSCVSTTDDCLGTVITDPLPAELEFVSLAGSGHTTNEVYNSGTHTVTFTFQNTLNAGTSGSVQIVVRFPNGITPGGLTVTNTAAITATNATTASSSEDVTSIASDKLTIVKSFEGGPTDEYMLYTFSICNTGRDIIENGILNPTSITVLDTLPAGTIFDYSDTGGVYDAASHSISWNVPDLEPGACYYPSVTVIYPSSTFSIGDNVSNTGYVEYTPIGETAKKLHSTVNHTLEAASYEGYLNKTVSNSTLYPEQSGSYTISFYNDSNAAIDSFYVFDSIPAGVRITDFNTGAWYANVPYSNVEITINYKTNLNTNWQSTSGSPYALNANDNVSVSSLGLAAGEYITHLSWVAGPDFFPIGSGISSNGWLTLNYYIDPGASAGVITNCVSFGGKDPSVAPTGGNQCVDVNINEFTAGVFAGLDKWHTDNNEFYSQGDTINVYLTVRNTHLSMDSLKDPTIIDLLPVELEYVPGSWERNWSNTGLVPEPLFTEFPNYKGTGRTALQFAWTGTSSYTFERSEAVQVRVKLIVTDAAQGGASSFYNEVALFADNITSVWGYEIVDTYDFDNDGDSAEMIWVDSAHFNINPLVSLESEKLVKGQLDTDWTKYPNTGYTDPGGLADYRLLIKNLGNVEMTDIVVLEILPHIGDVGVIDPNSRDSRWRPNLVDTVSAPVGVTVYYSTVSNPCRDTEGIDPSGPVGCTNPAWTTSPPADITTVQALKFDFGTNALAPGDTLELEWPMRAPINTLNTIGSIADTIAWSSFAYIANRGDNGTSILPAEPVKVGISMLPLVPGVIGDYVWDDTNQDGIQDVGESGVDGVRVELYKEKGNGFNDIENDSLVSFTITTDGGQFNFSNLNTDDYYLVFYKPDNYAWSATAQESTDTLDSDGVSRIYLGDTVAVTPIVNILNTEEDFSWDQGVYLGTSPPIVEICDNNIDDDGDGDMDCADSDCAPTVTLTLTEDEACENSTILSLDGGVPTGGVYSGTGVSGGNFNALTAGLGTHTITYTYTDANGCTNTATDDVMVINLPTVNLALVNDSDCVSSSSLALSGGSPSGGTYSGLGVTLTNFDATIAGAGVHTITYTYTDANNCSNTATDNIVVFALPTVSLNLPDTEECVLNNTFTLSGGSPIGGTYSGTGVSGTNFDATVAGLGTHLITYTYRDGNQCINSATQNIEVVAATSVSLSLGTDEACVLDNSLTLNGGTPSGGTYSGAGVSGTNFNASGAGAGTHNIFYTYTDANGCSNTAIDVITVYEAPSISTVVSNNPTTCGASNGNIEITGAGGTGNYEYRLDSGTWQASNTFSGLSAGNYAVYIRNDNGFCEAAYTSNPVNLSDPSNPIAQINLPSPGCIDVSNSFIATDAGLGATYAWNFGTGASPSTASGIGPHSVSYSNAGNKNITLSVTLAGCVTGDSESFTVNALPSVDLVLSDDEECITSNTLVLNDGSPSGGTYSGPGVSGTNFDASLAGVGTHTITYTYTDANRCINTATDDIEVHALPTVSLSLGTDEACVSETTLALSGGSPSGGIYSGTGVSGTNFNPSTAGAGTHNITYTYTDINGCINTAMDVIEIYDFPTINLVSSNNPTTCSGTNGSIIVTASGATGTFEYRLNSGTWQSSNTFSGLSAGSYNVAIRNANDFCAVNYTSNPVVLTDPPATTVTATVISNYTGEDISCVGAADGFAIAIGSSGTAPYTFLWSDGQTGDTLKNVTAGTYMVTATDDNGCQSTTSLTLDDPPPLGVTADFTNVSCYGGFDGSIDVTATGGVGAYTYAWDDISPIAFYPMDGNTDDISGNGYHAISISGTEAYSTDAVDGSASFEFDGGEGIRLDDGTFLDQSFTERTVTMYIKPKNLNGRQLLFEQGGSTDGFALYLRDEKLNVAVRESGVEKRAYQLDFPSDNAWHQVGAVFDNGDLSLILDGVVGPSFSTGFNTININAGDEAGLGRSFRGNASQNGNSNGQGFEGLMDNVTIYNEALRATQIADSNTDDGDRTGLPAGDYKVYVYDLNGCIDSISLTLLQPDSLALTANITDVLCYYCNSRSDFFLRWIRS